MTAVARPQGVSSAVVNEKLLDSKLKAMYDTSQTLGFFRGDPVLCGTWLWSFRVEQHDVGIRYSDTGGAAMSIKHFHEALHAQGALNTTWPDLDHLALMHGSGTFSPGDEAQADGLRFAQLYLLEMGDRPW
ncbi:hypothetical protein GGR57DRAFT_517056 [Xylariaceae sp. FL1272]|nr:hypothetical protein GGR57DRAFT_517056 [Xylariaceae sp. FL1272]